MRLLLFMLGVCVGIVWIEKPAEAQNYPWCFALRHRFRRDELWVHNISTMPGHSERHRRVLSAEQYVPVTAGTTSVCQGSKALFLLLTSTPSAAATGSKRGAAHSR